MSAGTDFDYSPAAFERVLGPAAMAAIARQVAAAPPPTPAGVERVRHILAATVQQIQDRQAPVAVPELPLAA